MLLQLLERQSRTGQPVGWDELVVAYDFALVGPSDIQAWARTRAWEGPACRRLVTASRPYHRNAGIRVSPT